MRREPWGTRSRASASGGAARADEIPGPSRGAHRRVRQLPDVAVAPNGREGETGVVGRALGAPGERDDGG